VPAAWFPGSSIPPWANPCDFGQRSAAMIPEIEIVSLPIPPSPSGGRWQRWRVRAASDPDLINRVSVTGTNAAPALTQPTVHARSFRLNRWLNRCFLWQKLVTDDADRRRLCRPMPKGADDLPPRSPERSRAAARSGQTSKSAGVPRRFEVHEEKKVRGREFSAAGAEGSMSSWLGSHRS
jgi:hypothetical protein